MSDAARSAVVTGGGAGIGRAICARLVADGWDVVAIERDAELAEALERALGAHVAVEVGDVTDRAVLARAAELAGARGAFRGWVNNAGVMRPGNLHAPVPDEVAEVLGVNLHAVFWGCQAAVARFLRDGTAGAIVNVSSIHGRAAFPNWAAYATSKGGVEALTRYVAVEYGAVGIRANAVAPGAIRTEEMTHALDAAPDPAAAEREVARMHPLGRLGEPAEVASVVAFLLSGEAAFLSGESIAVDGAATARCYPYDTELPEKESDR